MTKLAIIDTTPKVTILMGTRDGAVHLGAQLNSIANQTHLNWHLICSDDGSTDGSISTLEKFERKWPEQVTLRTGPNTGFSDNYMSLIRDLPEAPGYVCFADQDDIWLPEKITRALRGLPESDAAPALYCGRRTYWCPDRGIQSTSEQMTRPFALRNALIENVAPGNTIMLNPNAARLARLAARRTGHVFAHDWWLYLILTATGGHVHFDNDTPSILYRQHAQNEIGSGKGIMPQIQRKFGVLQGFFAARIDGNLAALEAIEDMLTPQARHTCRNFAQARKKLGIARLAALHRVALYRQSRTSTLGFWGAASLGRV